MREDDIVRDGWQALADYLGCSLSTVKKRRGELKKCGAVFERLKGKPPRKVISWFPSVIRQYVSAKMTRGERF